MSDALDLVYRSIDEQHADLPAATRRRFVTGAAATIGSMGLLGTIAKTAKASTSHNSTETILTVAATAEVLATIVNTVGWERGLGGDAVTQRNIEAAAREELVHYNVLASVGGKPVTKKIWVPDAVFANRTDLLNTLQVGDQIFVNAYLIATKHFADAGSGSYAAITAEFMGVEAVHRALARQSLGQLGNDRVFMKFDQQRRTRRMLPTWGSAASRTSWPPSTSSRPPASASASQGKGRAVLRLRPGQEAHPHRPGAEHVHAEQRLARNARSRAGPVTGPARSTTRKEPMPDVSPIQLAIVLIIALVILGPKRLPDMGKSLGRGIREFKDSVSGNDCPGRFPPSPRPPSPGHRRPAARDPRPPTSARSRPSPLTASSSRRPRRP